MIPNPFENSVTRLLVDFGNEYIRLAELIILFDKDQWDLIESAEKEVKKQRLMGMRTAFPDEKAARIHFMRLKVALITKNINENKAVRQAQTALSQYLRKHSHEVRTLGLSFKDRMLLTPTEIFANYHYLVQKIPGMVIAEPYNRKK